MWQCRGPLLGWHTGENDRGPYVIYNDICNECGAEQKWMARNDGSGMFASTKDRDGNLLPDSGWAVYKRGESVKKPVVRADDVDESEIPFMWLALLLPTLFLM